MAQPPLVPNDLIPIDHKGEAPSSHVGYMPNRGQLTAMQGGSVPDVLFYSIQSRPQTFFTNKNEVFFQLGARDTSFTTPDSIFRVGMKFIGPNVNPNSSPNAYEEQPDLWNFILGHLPEPLMGMRASRRIVYPDVYPSIDFHAYSNPWGPKFYIVMRPGSNPADVRLQFNGQDSLILDAFAQLKAYVTDKFVILPRGLCYQEINGSTVLVNAAVDYMLFPGDVSVGFNPVSYDPAFPLIIDISTSLGGMGGGTDMAPEWNTFYGHTEADYPEDALVLNDGSLMVCGITFSPSFPLENAQFDIFDGSAEAYYSEFNSDYSRRYTTFFGGNGFDRASSMAVTNDESSVYLTGRTLSTNLPTLQLGSGFFDNSPETSGDSFFARFSRESNTMGIRQLVTYFGQGIWTMNRLRVGPDDHVHVIGTTEPFGPFPWPEQTCQGTNGTFPICNPPGSDDFTQSATGGGADAFYLHFDDGFNLVHSTFFGGSQTEHGTDLLIDANTGNIYFVGNTASRRLAPVNCQPTGTTGGFPLCALPGAYFQQNLNVTNTGGLNDGYIASLSPEGRLLWSTYVGSTDDETGHYIGRSYDGSIYMAGLTNASAYSSVDCAPPSGSGFPRCASGSQVQYPRSSEAFDNYILKFNGSTKSLAWSTFIRAQVNSLKVGDEAGNMLVGLTAEAGMPVQPHFNTYFQPVSADPPGSGKVDGLVMGFTPNDQLLFSTYIGGMGNDRVVQALPWGGGRLYVVGRSFSDFAFPFNCPPTTNPYCYLSYATQSATTGEAFYAQLQYDVTIGIGEHETPLAPGSSVLAYPNPTDGGLSLVFGADWLNVPLATLALFDAAGRLVHEERLRPTNTAHTLQMPGNSPGAYMLRLHAENGLVHHQLILVR